MDYNQYYTINQNAFGIEPEKILVNYSHLISKKYPVLDVGAGQGRNTIYLSKIGYQVDAIDPSSVSLQVMKEIKMKENLSFRTFCSDFKDFSGAKTYSAVLIFGLIQLLDWEEIYLLKKQISSWIKEEDLLFLTSFTVDDDSHKTIRENSKKIGRNSYLKPTAEKRTFFEPGEIKNLFQAYKPIHYWEGLGPEHRHGNGPIERHAMVEAVFQKKKNLNSIIMTINKEWHKKNRMPQNATFEERVKWHVEHNKNCSCRPGFPKKLEEEMKKRGTKF